MKHFLKPAILPWLTLIAGGLGLALRIWLFTTGVDASGLLVAGHPAELFIWLLSAGMMVFLWFATRSLVAAPKYEFNYPRSYFGAAGCALAAVAIAVTSVSEIMGTHDTLTRVVAAVGLFASVAMIALALFRFQGRQPNIILHTITCVYFMIRLVSLYRHWSADPQLQDYCFQLLATVFLMLSTYCRAAFDVDMGQRRFLVLTHLAAVFFCYLSLVDRSTAPFYLTVSLWAFTDLCNLSPLPPQTQEEP